MLRFLRFAARAVVKYGSKVLADAVPFGGVLHDIASDLWHKYRQKPPADQKPVAPPPQAEIAADLQAVVQAPAAQLRQEAAAATEEVAADQPPALQQALTLWLTQVPAMVRRSLRRPSDPTGTTVPATLSLGRPEDLLPFLPPKLPRFKPGDRPLPGVDWELEELLGVGGFGEVWRARHPEYKGLVAALKFCLDARAAASLRNEADKLDRVMRHGRHAGIVPLRQVYLKADPPCLEYEYVEGGDLAGLIQEMHSKGPPRPDEVARWVLHLAGTIRFAHALTPQLVHRDLKPANILVQRSADGNFSLRVTDFGISELAAAQAVGEATRSHTNAATVVRGAYTPLYASPQQRSGDKADPRDDVHALGVIWYQLLTGDLMRGRPSGRGWRKPLAERGMSAGLLDLLEACVDDDPAERPADAGQLAQRLTALLQGGATEDDIGGHVERTLQQVRKTQAAAKEKAELEYDYTGATALLEPIPEHLRDATLYATVCQKRDRARLLETEVRAAAKELRLAGLRPKVEELLALLPRRDDLRRLLATLPEELVREFVNSLGMRLVLVGPGKFLMGSPANEEGRDAPWYRGADAEHQHEVEITRPFYIGVHPVTQEQYEKVMGENPSHFTRENGGAANYPVEQVSWDEAVEFCRQLPARPEEKAAGRTYRLPTEAEWEYSCRGAAASSTPFHFGASLSSAQANFDGNYPYWSVTL
jgi:hypothetical protein